MGAPRSQEERVSPSAGAIVGIHFSLLRCLGAVCALAVVIVSLTHAAEFDLSTATIPEINQAFDAGSLNAEKLVGLYLRRIEAYDRAGPKLNAIIALNPRALEDARALDAERKQKGRRSPLHGIPILMKDVFDVAGMPTTGGYAPLATSIPARDGFVVKKLREAGAVILGKTNLTDWFAEVGPGTSSLIGQTLCPYNLERYVGGSSAGTGAGIAAWFATLGFGSDTGGSVPHPSSHNALTCLVATQGLVSRSGMICTSFTQERPGPMARNVTDLAYVLDVIAGVDAEDLVSARSLGHLPDGSYTKALRADGLRGMRLGVLREMFRKGPEHVAALALTEQALKDLKAAGAEIVDPVKSGLDLDAELKTAAIEDFERTSAHNAYLARLPSSAPIHSVAEMIAQGGPPLKPNLLESTHVGPLDRNPAYLAGLAAQARLRDRLIAMMDEGHLDAVVMPFKSFDIAPLGLDWSRYHSGNPLHSRTGLPTLLVPAGVTPADGMPFGLQFLGRPWSEPILLQAGFGYEQATHHRRPPATTPLLSGERFSY